VLGHGLDRVYPSIHRDLADKIIEEGTLVTEFPTGTNPDRENFPKRNRIVAGMADATIVIESKQKGGSLITAYLASDYNRDVFAFPGNVLNETSQGCNELIRSHRACLIQSADEFLEMMNWEKSIKKGEVQTKVFNDLTPIQGLLASLISENPKIHLDLIAAKSKLPITEVNKELFTLEMNGIIHSQPGNTYSVV
jgi:DNA processing protein